MENQHAQKRKRDSRWVTEDQRQQVKNNLRKTERFEQEEASHVALEQADSVLVQKSNSLQPISQILFEEFIDENEPWLLIGISSRDPFLMTQYLE